MKQHVNITDMNFELDENHHKLVTIDDLREPEWYCKTPVKGNETALYKGIERYDFQTTITVNTFPGREGVIIDGVQTYRVAKKLGKKDIPVYEVSISQADEPKCHTLLNTPNTELLREQILNFFQDEYFSFFEANDEILNQDNSVSDAVNAGHRAMKQHEAKHKKSQRTIPYRPPLEFVDYPERAMNILKCKSLNETITRLLILCVGEDSNSETIDSDTEVTGD